MTDPAAPARPCDLLVTAAWVITVDAERRILRDGGGVAVTGGDTIVAVGKAADLDREFTPARRIDRPDAS